MTTPSTARKAGPFNGNGSTTSFPFTFKVFAAADIAVTIANSLGVETALVLDTDYSVSLNANQETSPGGTITYPISGTPLAVGSVLAIVGDLDYDQPLDLPSGGNFSPLALENQLDRTVMQIQQLREEVERSLRTSVTTGADVELPAPEANALIGWNSGATGLQNVQLEDLATAVAYATMRYDTFTGDGVATQFTLQTDPATLGNMDVSVDGQTYVPGIDHTLVGQNVVFTVAPILGAEILVRYGQGVVVATADAQDVSYLPAGTGAVATTVQSKLREIVTVDDFGAVGDGATNDTTALTNFFNSAISRPGVEHRLFAKTYAVSSVMPTINVSDVWITGEGAEIHDVGSLMTGTVLKWIGASGTTGPLVRITSVSGASNQRVSRVKFTGIGIDCNSGAINYGMEILSVWECDIDVCIANAGNTGFNANVVAALGEAKDTQRNKLRLKFRQVEAASAFCFTAGGDATSNFSKNELWIDAQHRNLQAIYLSNTDNNDWHFVRAYKVASGTTTESIACLGGPDSAQRVRAERFWHLSANTPLHAYGTGTYTVAAGSINIYNLDVENGSPNPIVDAGATVYWKKDTTALPDTPWSTYTPTLSATSGTLTSATAAGQYSRRGNIVYLRAQINITTNGTAAGALGFSLPIATTGTYGNTFHGKERALTGKAVAGYADGGGTTVCYLQFYDGTYPGSNGCVINVSGFYEVT